MPALACAVCPACLSTYAKLFSTAGAGFGLSETAHLAILGVAVVINVAVSAWRTRRTGRAWPLAVALLGATLVAVGHFADVSALEWAGVLTLLVGGLVEHFRLRRTARRIAAPNPRPTRATLVVPLRIGTPPSIESGERPARSEGEHAPR